MSKKSIRKSGLSARLEVRLPIETKEKLFQLCGNQFTASEMLRQIIERGEVPDLTVDSRIREQKALIEPVVIELARIGNNLNQVTRACNATLKFFNNVKEKQLKVDPSIFNSVLLQRLGDEIASLYETKKSLNNLMSDLIKWSNQNAG